MDINGSAEASETTESSRKEDHHHMEVAVCDGFLSTSATGDTYLLLVLLTRLPVVLLTHPLPVLFTHLPLVLLT